MPSLTPWMGTVTLTLANTAYQLSALIAAVAAADRPLLGSPPRCQFLAIQADPDAGGAVFYIGNVGLTSTYYGVRILPSQVWPIYSMDANLVRLDQIYVMCDTAARVLAITMITR